MGKVEGGEDYLLQGPRGEGKSGAQTTAAGMIKGLGSTSRASQQKSRNLGWTGVHGQ